MAKPVSLKKTVIRARKKRDAEAALSGDRVIVYGQHKAGQLASRSFGEMKGAALYLSLYEACLLAEEKKLEVCDEEGGKLSFKELAEAGERMNEGFGMKYDVFKDLRAARGYVVKSGIKFGCDFVVYPRGKTPANSHSKWMVHVMPEGARLDYSEITRAARLAANVKKGMLFATVTERGPVYYEIGHVRM
jgi:tRNA-intron endonuclease